MRQSPSQRRWYVNLTPEQREARRIRQRERRRERFATDPEFCERERQSNALRLYAGETYVGRAKSAEQAQEIRVLIELRYAERMAKIAEEREEFEKRLDAEVVRARAGHRVTIRL